MKFADLFCGIGGFHIALSQAGHECVFACDIDPKCREIYAANFGCIPHDDIYTIDETTLPDFDILTGGFPCQPFSNGGKKRALADTRGTLFQEIIRIANYKKPKYMILENVKHIKQIENGNVMKRILAELSRIGYSVTCMDVSPHQFGIPQKRERVFFVCCLNNIENGTVLQMLSLDKKSTKQNGKSITTNGYNICEMPSTDERLEKYRISHEIEKVLNAWDEIIQKMPNEPMGVPIWIDEFGKQYDISELPQWRQKYIVRNRQLYETYKEDWDVWMETHAELLQRRAIYRKLEWQVGPIKPNDSIYHYFIQLRQSGMRIRKTSLFPTLVAIVQTPIIGRYKRYLTPRECARLQSFPESFVMSKHDHDAYKQFGNSVNVEVVSYILKQMSI